MKEDNIDFYNPKNLKSYNLNESMKYQLSLLDSLDAFTRKHCENVANITCRLCEHLRLNRNFTQYCTICAYLHDIGKLFIPSSILQKPGSLTDEEYEIMKTHTTLGYNMCIKDSNLKAYANGALYHHEGLDGSGYPNHVSKNEIPLEGQIIRVADEFDAIVSKRQYKSHIGISDTLRLLLKEAQPVPKVVALKSMKLNTNLGKLNPKIVKALFKVVIEDTEYEIGCILDYMKYINRQIERLEVINKYNLKISKTKSNKKKDYYKACIDALLEGGETIKNYMYVMEDYSTAYLKKKEKVNNLFSEIKEIKRLRV